MGFSTWAYAKTIEAVDNTYDFISQHSDIYSEHIEEAYFKHLEYIIRWCHRDYNELWEAFPDEVKDIGKLWISTGIVNEDGRNKKAIEKWKSVLAY